MPKMDQPVSQKILEYTAIFEPAEEGGYVVSVPALPGCVTEGDTFEEATAMIKDAVEGYLQVLKEEGQTIPQEKSDIVIRKVTVNNPAAYI
jgi:antitoxin HicB